VTPLAALGASLAADSRTDRGFASFIKHSDAAYLAIVSLGLIQMSDELAKLVATAVDTRPMPLNNPRPNYTDAARHHEVQGVVRLRVLVGADGKVSKAQIVKGLPDGLNEEAMKAASKIRFRPAMKGGVPVPLWVAVDVEFNLRERAH
jgi:TonB family protein